MIDTVKLKELATAATDGPWTVAITTTSVFDSDVKKEIAEAIMTLDSTDTGRGIDAKQAMKNAEYIAAANPSTILDMIEQLEWYQQLVDILLTASKKTESVAFAHSCFNKEEYAKICKDAPALLKKLGVPTD